MPSANVRRSQRRTTLAFSYWEGGFWAIMVAIAENFSLYFAVRRGLDPYQVALVSTVPLFFGALMNWILPPLIRTGWLKWGIVGTLLVQILGLACLVVASVAENHFIWTFLGLCLYWAGGMGASPLWIDWISRWLPQERFGRFYSRRSAFLSFITLLSFLGASYAVHSFEFHQSFFWIFLVALVSRSISLSMIGLQSSPPILVKKTTRALDEPKTWSWTTLIVVIGFSALFKFVANIGSPFFLPYMVNELHFNAIEIALVNGCSFLGLAIFMASFGEALRTFQPVTGLQVAMVMAALNCLLWTFVQGIYSASALQLFSGLNWALFDLAGILIIQSNFPHAVRRLIGVQMAIVSLAVIGGSLFGSLLLESGVSSLNLFRISAAARFLVAFGFVGFVFFSSQMRVPLKTYGSFLKTAFSMRLGFVDILRVFPFLRQKN